MKKIRASKCQIKDISKDKKLIKEFLDENHNQGSAACRIAYGLYYNDELVQIMTFGIPRFNKNYQFELARDCTKKGYQVHGGVSKLWNKFVEEWEPESCICYSYPHDLDNLYTNKYVDYCGFKNFRRAKPAIKVYFEGEWEGSTKRIDKTILERHGVDRLLKVSIGVNSGTNEDILMNLGFEKKEEDGFDPQLDGYFVGGFVYKIIDLDTGKFYIGESTNYEDFFFDELETEEQWKEYYSTYKDGHNFDRIILREGFEDPQKMYEYKVKEIRKNCYKSGKEWIVDESTGCMNVETVAHKKTVQDFERASEKRGRKICPECGSTVSAHMKNCSQYHK